MKTLVPCLVLALALASACSDNDAPAPAPASIGAPADRIGDLLQVSFDAPAEESGDRESSPELPPGLQPLGGSPRMAAQQRSKPADACEVEPARTPTLPSGLRPVCLD